MHHRTVTNAIVRTTDVRKLKNIMVSQQMNPKTSELFMYSTPCTANNSNNMMTIVTTTSRKLVYSNEQGQKLMEKKIEINTENLLSTKLRTYKIMQSLKKSNDLSHFNE